MASEGNNNKTLAYVACIGAALAMCAASFAVGIGSNPGNPETDQLNNTTTDVTSPKVQALMAKLEANIDSCASLLQNQPSVEALQLQMSALPDDMAALKKPDGSARLTEAQLGNIREAANGVKANLDRLLRIAADCRKQRAPTEDVSTLWEAARAQASTLIDGSLTGERLSVYYMGSVDLTDDEIDETGADPGNNGSSVPLIRQDSYASVPYPRYPGGTGRSDTVAGGGCGLISALMVLQFYGTTIDVPSAARYALDQGFRGRGVMGTDYLYFPHMAKKYNLKYMELSVSNKGWEKIIEFLKSGTPVIVSGLGGDKKNPARPFSSGGHFIVLTDIKPDGTIGVNNPSKRLQDKTSYPLDHLKKYTKSVRVLYK